MGLTKAVLSAKGTTAMGRKSRVWARVRPGYLRAVVGVLLLCAGLGPSSLGAQPFSQAQRDAIPDSLKAWVPWVLRSAPDLYCPRRDPRDGAELDRSCLFVSNLTLKMDEVGATFELTAYADNAQDLALPGSSTTSWPMQVERGGKDIVVQNREGTPHIRVEAGFHRIEGRFYFKRAPELLPIPEGTGLVRVRDLSRKERTPRRNDDGSAIWLEPTQTTDTDTATDGLEITVHRRIEDGVPLQVNTELLLRVSGKARELDLGEVALPGTQIVDLASDLPSRQDENGHLRLQARAGEHRVTFRALRTTDAESFSPGPRVAPWPEEELWVFVPDNAVRQVNVSGGRPIDAQRTTLPEAWRGDAAYVIGAQDILELKTERRGQPSPPPHHIELKRTLWLDQDGTGYTVRDEVSGTAQSALRLDLSPGELGQVQVDGEGQVITKNPETGTSGVELRKKRLKVVADARLKDARQTLPAVGWTTDVQSLHLSLNLPPGWRLLWTDGVDEAPNTWLSRWDLWSLFFVLLVSLVIGRVVHFVWGILAFVLLVLSFHEGQAPTVSWLVLAAAVAWARSLTQPKWVKSGRIVVGVATLGLLVVALPFSVGEVRRAIYPTLADSPSYGAPDPYAELDEEESYEEVAPEAMALEDQADPSILDEIVSSTTFSRGSAAPAAPPVESEGIGYAGSGASNGGVAGSLVPTFRKKGQAGKTRATAIVSKDANQVVQTGPGVPTWQHQRYELSWSGPVERDHRIGLTLLPPLGLSLVALLRVLLIGLLGYRLIRAAFPKGPSTPSSKGPPAGHRPKHAAVAALLLGLVPLLGSTPARAQDFPPESLLSELRSTLIDDAACDGPCATLGALVLDESRGELELAFTVHAHRDAIVALPGPLAAFTPSRVDVDGRDAVTRRASDGYLEVRVPAGLSRVVLQGPVDTERGVNLNLPSTIPHVSSRLGEGWIVTGVDDRGVARDAIQLTPLSTSTVSEDAEVKGPALPPHFVLSREVIFDAKPRIVSTLRRENTAQGPAVVRIPRLKGETVDDDLPIEGDHLVVNVGADVYERQWTSRLPDDKTVSLSAATTPAYHETWDLTCTTLYQCETEGPPPVRLGNGRTFGPTFRPFQGETLHITTRRTAAAEGTSTTIDEATLELRPGVRLSEATLTLGVRSSTGGSQTITLPKGATPRSLTLNGAEQPLREKDGKLTVNVTPGRNRVIVGWQEQRGLSPLYASPKVRVDGAVVDATLEIRLPQERWLLFTAGPSWGPRVLFWGYLLLILLLSIGASLIPHSPLRVHQWVLLGLGLTQLEPPLLIVVAGWFFFVTYRERVTLPRTWHNLRQVAMLPFTFAMLMTLGFAVQNGLLSRPDMRVTGAGSSASWLRWYVDRTDGTLPEASVTSLPLWVWQLAMLLWALWLAALIFAWAKRAYETFGEGGFWIPMPPLPKRAVAAPHAVASTQDEVPASAPAGEKSTSTPADDLDSPPRATDAETDTTGSASDNKDTVPEAASHAESATLNEANTDGDDVGDSPNHTKEN